MKAIRKPERGVYAIECSDGRAYVGGSIDIANRWRAHRGFLRRKGHQNAPLQLAWSEMGERAFRFAVLEIVPETDDLTSAEQKWIDRYRAEGRAFNVAPSAGSWAGMHHTAEAKEKVSAARRGKALTPEHRAKVAAAGRGNANGRGERNGLAKLKLADVVRIRARVAAGVTQRALAAEYSVSRATIWGVVAHRTWAHAV